jgi:hypothetical protein
MPVPLDAAEGFMEFVYGKVVPNEKIWKDDALFPIAHKDEWSPEERVGIEGSFGQCQLEL